LVQGTIAPDWIETKGGIKTQHNVLVQIGIDPEKKFGFNLIEPIANLYKDQVRKVLNTLESQKKLLIGNHFQDLDC
jgi:GMP synthase, PP-ATPase domain/subunit